MTNSLPTMKPEAPASADVEVPSSIQLDMKRMKNYYPYRHVFAVLEKAEWFVYAKTTKHTLNAKLRAGLPVFMQERT